MTDVMLVDSDDDFIVQSDDESDFSFSDGDGENAAPIMLASKKKGTVSKKKAAPATKKASAPKKAASKKAPTKKKPTKPLGNLTNGDNIADKDDESIGGESIPSTMAKGNAGGKEKTIEQRYQKKTQLEHILLRPDTYIGSVKPVTQNMHVRDSDSGKIVEREVTFVPGLFKIFDEIVVNAADNKQRDNSMDKMDITIDAETNTISVTNNGSTIPVVMHKEHNCYVPSLIFGHLLTGSNFDDDEKRTTGGRNGYGAKLTNIFSTEFTLECTDTTNKIKFSQTWRNNMMDALKPSVKTISSPSVLKAGDRTKISFKPDLAKFNMGGLDKDIVELLSKRAYDIAAAMSNAPGKRLIVTLNGDKVSIKTFKDFVALFEGLNAPAAFEKVNDRWEVGVGPSVDGTFQQVSFVNSICTFKGGNHVNYIADQVASKLVEVMKKKNKGGTVIKASQIKNHLCIFVNCLVENPSFDSQTKEFLSTRSKEFGSECKLTDAFLKKIEKSDVISQIMSFAKFKQQQELNKKGAGRKKTKLTGIAKLDDANFAGGAKSKDCTLILTEGDSAKSLAMSGISVVGRDYYGVFPLKGKPLNVRDASFPQIMKNEEIKNLVDIMGFKFQEKYDEDKIKSLRYGHLMIMADQDSDGSHITGLVINIIHHFWPSLLDIDGFLQRFITPIVKVTKAKLSKTFFTLPEFEEWKEQTSNGKGFNIKYYKGLGTSTNAEAKEYFSNLDQHEINFSSLTEDVKNISLLDSGEDEDHLMEFDENHPNVIPSKPITGADCIDLAFNKSRVEDRKKWLNKMKADTYLNYAEAQRNGGIQYSDFINKELILFSRADNIRSIPHIMDGFKPSQRKVLYACFKRKLKGEIKVAQLAGYIGEHSAYHHGEASLAGTIIGLAQSFCGSNNVNLLTPAGQFGTRRMGGKDHASPRYIFTSLEKVTRTIFHPDDDALLSYLNDDGMSIEPEYYVPVIPTILVNGADGIGTGWSTKIPNYNAIDIINNLRRRIKAEGYQQMRPSYNGFMGDIVPSERSGTFNVTGRIERIDDTTLIISELPLKVWTQDYKEFLEKLLLGDSGKKIEPEITDFKENHTDDTVHFTVSALKEQIDKFEKDKNGLMGKFKLSTSLTTTNMTLFNTDGRILKFDQPEAILESFFNVRMDFYVKRKAMLLDVMRREQLMLANKARFVAEVCKGDLVVNNRKRKDILADLQTRGYDLFDKSKDGSNKDKDESSDSEDENETSDADLAKGYEYLLGMKIWNLTFEKVRKLKEEYDEKTRAVEVLEATEPSDIWLTDLDSIETALAERDEQIRQAQEEERAAQRKNKKHQSNKRGKAAAKKAKKKALDDDIMSIDDSEDDYAPKKAAPKKRAVPKATKSKAAQKEGASRKAQTTVDLDVDSDVDVPLADGPAKLGNQEEIVPKDVAIDVDEQTSSSTSGKGKNRLSDSSESDISEAKKSKNKPASSATAATAKKATAAAKKAPAPKKKAAAPANKKTAAAAHKGAKGPKKKFIDSDDESDLSDDEEVVAAPIKPRARSARAVTTKKVEYTVDSESTDEEEFDSGAESDSDFD